MFLGKYQVCSRLKMEFQLIITDSISYFPKIHGHTQQKAGVDHKPLQTRSWPDCEKVSLLLKIIELVCKVFSAVLWGVLLLMYSDIKKEKTLTFLVNSQVFFFLMDSLLLCIQNSHHKFMVSSLTLESSGFTFDRSSHLRNL